MSGRNDEISGMAIVFGLIGFAFLLVGMIAFAALILVACFLTGMAFTAWNRPQEFFGRIITPEEARGFVTRGVAGAFGLPAFVRFCGALYDVQINDQAWFWLVVGGYIAGSIGIGIFRDEFSQVANNEPSAPALPAQRSEIEPSPQHGERQFTYASWDDEEHLK